MNIEEYRKSLEDYRAYDRSGQELTHWGISGMKWGRRRWQNEDGSLTEEGRIHYGVGAAREAAKQEQKNKAFEAKLERKAVINQAKADAIRLKAEKQNTIDIAKQDRKAVEAEAAAETKNRKISAAVEKQAESNRHKEASLGRKLLIGAGVVAGAAVLLKLYKEHVDDMPSPSSGAKAKAEKIVSENKDTKVSDLKPWGTTLEKANERAKSNSLFDWASAMVKANSSKSSGSSGNDYDFLEKANKRERQLRLMEKGARRRLNEKINNSNTVKEAVSKIVSNIGYRKDYDITHSMFRVTRVRRNNHVTEATI